MKKLIYYTENAKHTLRGTINSLNSIPIPYNELHRLVGPAIKYHDGRIEYWIKGKKHSKAQYEQTIQLYKEGLDILL